jgi:nucleoside-diphosphate-sugar epimerase
LTNHQPKLIVSFIGADPRYCKGERGVGVLAAQASFFAAVNDYLTLQPASKFVMIGSGSVFGSGDDLFNEDSLQQPYTDYGKINATVEALFRETFASAVGRASILRLPNVALKKFTRDFHFSRRLLDAATSGAPSVTLSDDGSAVRNFVYVSDILEALIRIAERETVPPSINLAGPAVLTSVQFAELFFVSYGLDPSRVEIKLGSRRPAEVRRVLGSKFLRFEPRANLFSRSAISAVW